MIKVVICGAGGRMGRQNIAVFNSDRDVKIIGAVEDKQSKLLGYDAGTMAGIDSIGIKIISNLEGVVEESDALVVFTNPEATLDNLKSAKKYGKAIVIGTTGFTEDQISKIKEYSNNIPIVLSPNMSQGVNILFYLVKKASELLGEQYDVEILEMHHNCKKDAPSGTAVQFGKIIAQTRGKSLEEIVNYTRHGIVGERPKGEIGISSLRLSDVVGDHSVIFGGPGERIEFTHKSNSRKNYSTGALRAVKWIFKKQNGFFSMNDVLGIK